jgi:hypothetical protein
MPGKSEPGPPSILYNPSNRLQDQLGKKTGKVMNMKVTGDYKHATNGRRQTSVG